MANPNSDRRNIKRRDLGHEPPASSRPRPLEHFNRRTTSIDTSPPHCTPRPYVSTHSYRATPNLTIVSPSPRESPAPTAFHTTYTGTPPCRYCKLQERSPHPVSLSAVAASFCCLMTLTQSLFGRLYCVDSFFSFLPFHHRQ